MKGLSSVKIVNAGASHGRRQERGLSSLLAEYSLSGRLPKRARKNSSLEEDGISALCPLIGQCVAESLGGGIRSREKINLWLLQIHVELAFLVGRIFVEVAAAAYWSVSISVRILGGLSSQPWRILEPLAWCGLSPLQCQISLSYVRHEWLRIWESQNLFSD